MLQTIKINYKPNVKQVREYRQALLDHIDHGDSEADKRSSAILEEILNDFKEELSHLWKQFPSARYIGINYLTNTAIIGNIKNEVVDEGLRLFGKDKVLFDYVAQRNPTVCPSFIVG